MSDYQNLDLRSPRVRRTNGLSLRGVLITIVVVIALFLVLFGLGAGTRGGDPAIPAGDVEQTAPAATQPLDQ